MPRRRPDYIIRCEVKDYDHKAGNPVLGNFVFYAKQDQLDQLSGWQIHNPKRMMEIANMCADLGASILELMDFSMRTKKEQEESDNVK